MIQKVSNIFVKINQLTPQESNNPRLLRKLLRSIAKELDYTILKSAFHTFKPTGFTGILLLSESHISIHTWPEENFAALEMVTCKLFSMREKNIVIEAIKKILNTTAIEFTLNV